MVRFDPNFDYTVIDTTSASELAWYLSSIDSAGYVERTDIYYSLTAKGWDYLYGPSAAGGILGRCFVAMSLSKEHEAIFHEGIAPAVAAAGYDAVWMKDLLTNEDICFRMVAEIRRCQFLIADFTGLKGGVYFEAGFALGLGRPVFWTTRKDEIDRIHFDTNHYQHILWDDTKDTQQPGFREKIVSRC